MIGKTVLVPPRKDQGALTSGRRIATPPGCTKKAHRFSSRMRSVQTSSFNSVSWLALNPTWPQIYAAYLHSNWIAGWNTAILRPVARHLQICVLPMVIRNLMASNIGVLVMKAGVAEETLHRSSTLRNSVVTQVGFQSMESICNLSALAPVVTTSTGRTVFLSSYTVSRSMTILASPDGRCITMRQTSVGERRQTGISARAMRYSSILLTGMSCCASAIVLAQSSKTNGRRWASTTRSTALNWWWMSMVHGIDRGPNSIRPTFSGSRLQSAMQWQLL